MKKFKFDIPKEILALVEVVGKKQVVKSNEVLLRVGQKCRSGFFIKSGGFVCQLIDSKTGEERTVNFYMDSFQAFMSATDSYFGDVESSYQIKAFKKSEIFELPRKTVELYVAADADISVFYQNLIVNTLLIESDFKSKLICLNAEELYKYLIDNYPELIRDVPSKYIAEFMGISPQWLSKIKHKIRLMKLVS